MKEDNSLLEVSEYDRFLTNYKAVYQAMTAKNDCKSKIFSKSVKIELRDIYDLNARITEKLSNYNILGFTISATASFKGKQTIEFSSWNEFENHKWIESNALTAITVIWEFNVLLPNYEIPQKHLLVVKMTDGLRPEEMLNIVFAGKLENIDEIEKQICPVVARVDFINYILGDELLSIVEEWDNGLPVQYDEENKFVNMAKKHRRKLAFGINYITDIIYLICAIRLLNYRIHTFNVAKLGDLYISNIEEIIWATGIFLIMFIFINKISEWLANMLYRTLGEESDVHIFEINKGDTNLQDTLLKKNARRKWSVITSIAGTVFINLFCNIVSSAIIK